MEGAEEELERRSKFLHSLIQKKKSVEQEEQHECLNVRVRASDMPLPLQNRAFRCARDHLDSMPGKLDSKRLALALKKVKFTLLCLLQMGFIFTLFFSFLF
jgi:dynein light chain LC8-type